MRRFSLLLAPVLLALAGPLAHAGTAITLGPASGYNVFVLGAYSTPGNTDIQGSVAVGGAFTATGNLSISEVPGSAAPSTVGLVVGGNLSLSGGQLDNTGDAWVGGNVSSGSSFNFEHNLNYAGTFTPADITVGGTTSKISASAIPINFTSAATSLTQLSNTLEGMAANGSVVLAPGSNYNLTATGCSVCIFDLTSPAGGFSSSSINIDAPAEATVVVNVTGSTNSFSFTSGSINYSGGVTANDTIFNFDTAATLTTSSMTINASILAPFAQFTGTNGSVDGELIAGSVSGESAEMESTDIFSGNLGTLTTPEPATWVLMTVVLIGFFIFRARGTKKTFPAPDVLD